MEGRGGEGRGGGTEEMAGRMDFCHAKQIVRFTALYKRTAPEKAP